MKRLCNIRNLILVFFIGIIIFASLYFYNNPFRDSDAQIFSKIYEEDRWTGGSGPGSYPQNTVGYRKLLQEYFNDPRFKTIVDLGCGDFQFMKFINIPNNKIYKGIDVVAKIIENNKKLYARDNIQFYVINDLYELLPGSELLTGDLLIVKDVLMHLPNKKIKYFIDKILPNFKYTLITDTIIPNTNLNQDISTGEWRPVDITAPPFNLNGVEIVMDYGRDGWTKRVYFYVNPSL